MEKETKEKKVAETFFMHSEAVFDGNRFTLAAAPIDEKNFDIGVSVCSHMDNFNRKIGRDLAGKRAVENPFCRIGLDHGKDQKDAAIKAMEMIEPHISIYVREIMQKIGEIDKNNKTDGVHVKEKK